MGGVEENLADPRVRLPKGRHFALTWSIPDNFGGMTSAMLHRSRAFVRLGARPVDILTFDARTDYPEVAKRLRESGELIEGMRLLNLWDWMRAYEIPTDVAGTLDLEKHVFTPLGTDPAYFSGVRGDVELARTRYAIDGTTALQVDYYREDGSLLVSDRRDARSRGTLGGRSVVLCDAAGKPLRSWGRVWAFYRLWLDILRDREPSFMVVDSKTVANFMMTYRRKRAVTMHVVHNSHLQGEKRPIAPLRASRRPVFENLPDFDAVVVLTKRQKADIEALLGDTPNVRVIPNSRDLPTEVAEDLERPIGRGIVLAALTSRKRVDHAARAALEAAEVGDEPVTLDVFGDGEERERLQWTLDYLDAGETVRLHGYDSRARDHLADSSFIVLTGRTEGFPLVLVEAMAAGCIPIAYDVPYGPADIITHGRNGFLVAPGDEAGLTDAIVALQRMSPRKVARLRRRARKAAAKFSDSAVTATWAREMRLADARKRAAWELKQQAG